MQPLHSIDITNGARDGAVAFLPLLLYYCSAITTVSVIAAIIATIVTAIATVKSQEMKTLRRKSFSSLWTL
jgi:phage-related minor tail protein